MEHLRAKIEMANLFLRISQSLVRLNGRQRKSNSFAESLFKIWK